MKTKDAYKGLANLISGFTLINASDINRGEFIDYALFIIGCINLLCFVVISLKKI